MKVTQRLFGLLQEVLLMHALILQFISPTARKLVVQALKAFSLKQIFAQERGVDIVWLWVSACSPCRPLPPGNERAEAEPAPLLEGPAGQLQRRTGWVQRVAAGSEALASISALQVKDKERKL